MILNFIVDDVINGGNFTANPLDKLCFLAPGAGSGPGFIFL
jgi:hypothetical protein